MTKSSKDIDIQVFGKPHYLFVLVFLALLTGYSGLEIYNELNDLGHGASPLTVGMEVLIISTSIGFIYYLTRILYKNLEQQKVMANTLSQVREQLKSSNQRLQHGKDAFRDSIDWQLDEWQLTQTQKEIALLLLKGLSTKEMAELRHVQEKTIRNHLSAIYEKSGLPGRHVFSAWFFEGLL